MARINIHDLDPSGSKLVINSDSYLNELGNQEISDVKGGMMDCIRMATSIMMMV